MGYIIIIGVFILFLYVTRSRGAESQKPDKKNTKVKKQLPVDIIGKSFFELKEVKNTESVVPTSLTQKSESEDVKDNFDIDFPLEEEIEIPEVVINLEEEELIESFEGEIVASGIDFDNLNTLQRVLDGIETEPEQVHIAGEVLYENQESDLCNQIVLHNAKTAQHISSLIDLHLLHLESE